MVSLMTDCKERDGRLEYSSLEVVGGKTRSVWPTAAAAKVT